MAVLLRRTRGVTLLVTARKPLGVQDERGVAGRARRRGAPLTRAIHSRLPEPERRAFAHLAVFVGGAAPDEIEGASPRSSTVASFSSTTPGRLHDGATVREYAVARLEARGETEPRPRQPTDYVCELARPAARACGDRGAGVSERLERELPNVRAAFAWMLAHGRHATCWTR